MSIQASFNQALYSGSIAAGFYAHSPQGQTQAKIKELDRKIKGENKQWEIESAAAVYHDDPNVAIKIDQKHSRRIADLKAEKYKLEPNEKAYRSYMKAVKETRGLKANYRDRISYLTAEQWKQIEKAQNIEDKYTIKKGGDLNNG